MHMLGLINMLCECTMFIAVLHKTLSYGMLKRDNILKISYYAMII